jgi:uncharacterized protein
MGSLHEPVTVVVAQRVKPTRTADYETWISNITQVASTYPGYLGTHIIRPQAGVRPEYVVVFRFDGYENLKTWMTSRDRQYWLTQASSMVISAPQIQQLNGVEAWFSIPGQAVKPPPRYKMALLTWGAVYGLINLLNRFITPFLQAFPVWIASLVICGIMVGLLTYIVMPQVARLFAPWLYPSR